MAAQSAVAEGPAPGLRFAPFLRRLIAYIIDEALIGALSVVIVVVLAQVTSVAGENGRGLIAGLSIVGSLLLVLVLWFIYFPWCWSHGGQTIGGRLLGIRVVSGEDGSPIGFGTGIVRLIGYIVCQAVLYIGFIWALFDKRKRGWHDMIAGTSVVNA